MHISIDYEKLGMRIKELRLSKNLTQDYLAQAADCNVSHISNIENNHTKVSLIVLLELANALNVTIDYLLADQYENTSLALDNEIMNVLAQCDIDTKKRVLRVINALRE